MEQLTLWDMEGMANHEEQGTGTPEGYDDEGNLINPKDNEEG